MENKPVEERGFEPLTLAVTAAVGALCMIYGLAYSEYQRNYKEAYSNVTFYESFTDRAAAEANKGKFDSYYYCPKHTPGRDPQQLAMQAATYGWTLKRCPDCVVEGAISASTTNNPKAK